MKNKVGDKVKIVSNESDHGFAIGSHVEITKVNPKLKEYVAKDDNDWWWLKPKDVEEI
tara:strand:- start:105 stop:278 length:174 start_codon:yes stop_codon:yes gene_type:complete